MSMCEPICMSEVRVEEEWNEILRKAMGIPFQRENGLTSI